MIVQTLWTFTDKAADFVFALSAVQARRAVALVDVIFTVFPLEACQRRERPRESE